MIRANSLRPLLSRPKDWNGLGIFVQCDFDVGSVERSCGLKVFRSAVRLNPSCAAHQRGKILSNGFALHHFDLDGMKGILLCILSASFTRLLSEAVSVYGDEYMPSVIPSPGTAVLSGRVFGDVLGDKKSVTTFRV